MQVYDRRKESGRITVEEVMDASFRRPSFGLHQHQSLPRCRLRYYIPPPSPNNHSYTTTSSSSAETKIEKQTPSDVNVIDDNDQEKKSSLLWRRMRKH